MKIYDLQLTNILEESKSDDKVIDFVSVFEKNINLNLTTIKLLNKEQIIESFSELSEQLSDQFASAFLLRNHSIFVIL